MKKLHLVIFILLLSCTSAVAQHSNIDSDHLLTLQQNQQYIEAAEYILSVQGIDINTTKLLNQIAYFYRMGNDNSNAEKYYTKSLDLDDTNMTTLINIAAIHNRKGNKPKAKEYYNRILELDSNNFQSFYALADLMRFEKDSTGTNMGSFYYQKAYSLQPRNLELALDYAIHLISLEQLQSGNKILNEALEVDSANFHVIYTKAQLSLKLKNYRETIQLCKKMIELGNAGPDILSLMAQSYYNLEDYKSCLSTYQKILEVKDKLGEMEYYYMSASAKNLKLYKDAVLYIDLTIQEAISPNTAYYYTSKGDLHELRGEFQKSASALSSSFNFEIIPNNYYKLALLYDFKIKNKRQAVANYKRYLNQELTKEDDKIVEYVKKRLESLK